jgi:hypothetical protein
LRAFLERGGTIDSTHVRDELDRLDRFLAKVTILHEECDRIQKESIQHISLWHSKEGPLPADPDPEDEYRQNVVQQNPPQHGGHHRPQQG